MKVRPAHLKTERAKLERLNAELRPRMVSYFAGWYRDYYGGATVRTLKDWPAELPEEAKRGR